MSALDPPLGTIVEVSVGRGVVRFSGATSFKPGKWVGIELLEPNGKNDGSVDGVTYFACKMNYGVFVRASQIKATFGSENDTVRVHICLVLPHEFSANIAFCRPGSSSRPRAPADVEYVRSPTCQLN